MTAEDQTRLRGACFCLWVAGRYRDPVRLAVRFGLDVEAVRQWREAFKAQYAPVRAHMKAFDLRLLGRLPAWERCELTRRVLAERERRMQRERRLRPARIRAGLAVLEGWQCPMAGAAEGISGHERARTCARRGLRRCLNRRRRKLRAGARDAEHEGDRGRPHSGHPSA